MCCAQHAGESILSTCDATGPVPPPATYGLKFSTSRTPLCALAFLWFSDSRVGYVMVTLQTMTSCDIIRRFNYVRSPGIRGSDVLCCYLSKIITPLPVGGRVLFLGDFFLSFFISLSSTLQENGWTDLHEIFRGGVEWPWDDLVKFWVNSGKRVGGSKVNLFVITGHSSEDWR